MSRVTRIHHCHIFCTLQVVLLTLKCMAEIALSPAGALDNESGIGDSKCKSRF